MNQNKQSSIQRTVSSIIEQAGIQEVDTQALNQLCDFVHNQATTILEEAKLYARNKQKPVPSVEDVQLAVEFINENFNVLSRSDVLQLAKARNSISLPYIKPHYGIRLPPDRYCTFNTNYALKRQPMKRPHNHNSNTNNMRLITKPNPMSVIKSIPTKNFSNGPNKEASVQKVLFKPKINFVPNKHIGISQLKTETE